MGRNTLIANGLTSIGMENEAAEHITIESSNLIRINAEGLLHRDLNVLVRNVIEEHSPERISIYNTYGQRYIGTSLRRPVNIDIHGTPGNDLGAFMDGPVIHVYGNAQDGSGNTMNNGEIVVHGNAGDIVGFAARGGEIYVKGDVGYRVGIHMKEYEGKAPTLVIGGKAQDFLGEYMAGGRLIALGLNFKEGECHKSNFIGTGMHGGVIYLRGCVQPHQLGKEVSQLDVDEDDMATIEKYVTKYAEYFDYDVDKILNERFMKLLPLSHRPYGRLYAY